MSRRPEMPAEQARIARSIGIGAVKYAGLSGDRIKHYIFDWKRMLGPNTNTAQAPAEPIRPPEVNRVYTARDRDEDRHSYEDRRASRPHPGSPQTQK